MIDVAEVIAGNEGKEHDYARKRNAASMLQRIISCLHIEGLSGEGLWRLVSLAWITKELAARIEKLPGKSRWINGLAWVAPKGLRDHW